MIVLSLQSNHIPPSKIKASTLIMKKHLAIDKFSGGNATNSARPIREIKGRSQRSRGIVFQNSRRPSYTILSAIKEGWQTLVNVCQTARQNSAHWAPRLEPKSVLSGTSHDISRNSYVFLARQHTRDPEVAHFV